MLAALLVTLQHVLKSVTPGITFFAYLCRHQIPKLLSCAWPHLREIGPPPHLLMTFGYDSKVHVFFCRVSSHRFCIVPSWALSW